MEVLPRWWNPPFPQKYRLVPGIDGAVLRLGKDDAIIQRLSTENLLQLEFDQEENFGNEGSCVFIVAVELNLPQLRIVSREKSHHRHSSSRQITSFEVVPNQIIVAVDMHECIKKFEEGQGGRRLWLPDSRFKDRLPARQMIQMGFPRTTRGAATKSDVPFVYIRRMRKDNMEELSRVGDQRWANGE